MFDHKAIWICEKKIPPFGYGTGRNLHLQIIVSLPFFEGEFPVQ